MENPVENPNPQDSNLEDSNLEENKNKPPSVLPGDQIADKTGTKIVKARKIFSFIVIFSALVSVAVLILFNTGSESSLPFWTLQTRTQALLAAVVFFVLMTAGKFFIGLYYRIFKLEKTSWMNLAGLLVLVAISLVFFLLASIVITLAKGYVF